MLPIDTSSSFGLPLRLRAPSSGLGFPVVTKLERLSQNWPGFSVSRSFGATASSTRGGGWIPLKTMLKCDSSRYSQNSAKSISCRSGPDRPVLRRLHPMERHWLLTMLYMIQSGHIWHHSSSRSIGCKNHASGALPGSQDIQATGMIATQCSALIKPVPMVSSLTAKAS